MVVAFYLDSTEISRARRHTLFLFPRVVQINNRTLKTGFPIVLKANSVTEKANTVTPTRCQSSGQIFGCFYEVYLSRGGGGRALTVELLLLKWPPTLDDMSTVSL